MVTSKTASSPPSSRNFSLKYKNKTNRLGALNPATTNCCNGLSLIFYLHHPAQYFLLYIHGTLFAFYTNSKPMLKTTKKWSLPFGKTHLSSSNPLIYLSSASKNEGNLWFMFSNNSFSPSTVKFTCLSHLFTFEHFICSCALNWVFFVSSIILFKRLENARLHQC